MYRFTITLKVVVVTAGGNIDIYPVIERVTNTESRRVVEHAVVNRYIRDNWGSVVSVEVARTSARKVAA